MYLTFHKKDAIEKIKEATIKLLTRKSYADISMRMIAKEADVALGQVTYYYHTKSSLILEVVKEALDFVGNDFVKRVGKSKNKIETVKKIMLEDAIEDDDAIVLIFNLLSESMFNPKLKVLVDTFVKRIHNFLLSLYKEETSLNDEEIRQEVKKLIDETLVKYMRGALIINRNE